MARPPKKPNFGDFLAETPGDRAAPASSERRSGPPPGPVRIKGFRPRRKISVPAPLIVTILLGGTILLAALGSLRLENSLSDNSDRLVIPEEQQSCRKDQREMLKCYPGNPAALRAIIGAGQLGIKNERLPAVYDIPSELQPPAEAKGAN